MTPVRTTARHDIDDAAEGAETTGVTRCGAEPCEAERWGVVRDGAECCGPEPGGTAVLGAPALGTPARGVGRARC